MEVITEINKQVVETLFKSHYKGLCRYAFSILKDQEEAEEVVQKLFIKMWEKRQDIEILKDVRAYLYRSTYNQSLNELNRLKRNAMNVDITDGVMIKTNTEASDRVMSTELEEIIESAVCSLPDKCGEVFRLSRFSQLSYKEIALKLDISVKTVENHMGKALKLMRIELEAYLPLILVTFLLLKTW